MNVQSRTTMLTPLMMACNNGSVDVVRVLVGKRCNVWLTNVNKQSAISIVQAKKAQTDQKEQIINSARGGADRNGNNTEMKSYFGNNRHATSAKTSPAKNTALLSLPGATGHGGAVAGSKRASAEQAGARVVLFDANGRALDRYGIGQVRKNDNNWAEIERELNLVTKGQSLSTINIEEQ
jgi:hypothetical protein